MKLDMDLARRILAEIEASDSISLRPKIELPDRSEAEISYHVMLLSQAGLIEAQDISSPERLRWVPGHLTMAGHELLEMSRRDTLWERAKTTVRRQTGGLALELVRIARSDLARKELGL